jgi:hypothetical protein
MNKYLRVTMPDGTQWDVPAGLIALDRANYYATTMNERDDEYAYALDNPDELLDWAANNMNWADVASEAREVGRESTDYQEGWINGEKEIVEYEDE